MLATSTPSRATDWTGAASTDWFTAGNWSAGVPTSATPVHISTVTPRATVIGATGAQAQFVFIGDSTTGKLTIQNGGTLSNGLGEVGVGFGAVGTVTVDGAGSSWTNSANLILGDTGAGTLTVQNGGKVSNVIGLLGSNAGSAGTATVDGAGSSWSSSGGLFVGSSGIGMLTI